MRVRVRKTERSERGAALVIALFTLMLISVVATALILMAGTQAAVKGNYKSSMHAFYDAKAGLEEARGRLWAFNPNNISNCVFPARGTPMPVDRAGYIVNPSNGETVDPTNLDPANPYADFEYKQEFQKDVTAATGLQPPIPSTSPLSGGIAGPLYKWVRITPRTEYSGNIDVDAINGLDPINPLFYDGTQQLLSTAGAAVPNAAQVFTVTALAVTPYGSRRMVQYTVAPSAFASALATFPSALTLDGNGVQFKGSSGGNQGSGNGNFQINGNDINGSSGAPGISAIGYTNSSDGPGISTAAVPSNNYLSPQNPPVGVVTLSPMLQTPSGLDSLVQSITQNADSVLNPPSGTAADQTSLPSAMSAQNPMIVVVNGDFNLHGHGTGYGLLLVTGTLDYDPDAFWNGVILVIGKGIFTST